MVLNRHNVPDNERAGLAKKERRQDPGRMPRLDSAPDPSGRLGWIAGILQPCNQIAQGQAALLQTEQRHLINGQFTGNAIHHGIQIGMLHAQFDQAPLRGMQVFVHSVNSAQ